MAANNLPIAATDVASELCCRSRICRVGLDELQALHQRHLLENLDISRKIELNSRSSCQRRFVADIHRVVPVADEVNGACQPLGRHVRRDVRGNVRPRLIHNIVCHMRGHVHRRTGSRGHRIQPLCRRRHLRHSGLAHHIGHVRHIAPQIGRIYLVVLNEVSHLGDPKLPRQHPNSVLVQGEKLLSLFQLSMKLLHGAGRFVEPIFLLTSGHQIDDPTVAVPARPALPLEGSCRRGYGIEADDQVHVGNVESFLSNARGDEQVASAGRKVGQHLLLLALLHAGLPLATATLADEHLGTNEWAHGFESIRYGRHTISQRGENDGPPDSQRSNSPGRPYRVRREKLMQDLFQLFQLWIGSLCSLKARYEVRKLRVTAVQGLQMLLLDHLALEERQGGLGTVAVKLVPEVRQDLCLEKLAGYCPRGLLACLLRILHGKAGDALGIRHAVIVTLARKVADDALECCHQHASRRIPSAVGVDDHHFGPLVVDVRCDILVHLVLEHERAYSQRVNHLLNLLVRASRRR